MTLVSVRGGDLHFHPSALFLMCVCAALGVCVCRAGCVCVPRWVCVCAVLGLHSCVQVFSISWEQGLLSSRSVRASLVVEHRPYVPRFQ